MISFVFFPIIIGDLIPENDEIWAFVLVLVQIIDLLLSFEFTEEKIISLQQLIKQHNTNYVLFFGDSIIKYSGPPRHYWCFRFEAKHKELKLYAHATTSRKHITLTLAKKFQLKFTYSLIQQPIPTIVLKEKYIVLSQYSAFICNSLNVLDSQFTCYREIDYKGTSYKRGYFLTDFVNDDMCLHKIIEIVIIHNEEKDVKPLTQQIKVEYIHPHYESYIVDCSKIISMQNFNDITYFHSFPINISQLANGQKNIYN